MSKNLAEAINRAKYLLGNASNAAMATVNEDGSPHNTPLLFMHDYSLESVYWASHPESLHSKNVSRDGRVFIVVYEANQGGGLYIKAYQARMLQGDDLVKALLIHNQLRRKADKDELPLEYYQGDSPQRMYGAAVQAIYVNYGQRDTDGNMVRDIRQEISATQLQQN